MVLDVDSSAFEAHGQQELIDYDGYRDAHIYHPLLVFDARDVQLITAILRAGDVGDSRGAPGYLEGLIGRIKTLRPDLDVVVRAAANFAKPRQYRTIEEIDDICGGADYLLGVARNSVLEKKLEETMKKRSTTLRRPARRPRSLSDSNTRPARGTHPAGSSGRRRWGRRVKIRAL